MYKNRYVGKVGETYALEYLVAKSYRIRHTNAYSRWGEIDIVAEKNGKIHFIEVKSRISGRHGKPCEAVTYYKKKHLERTIQYYIFINKLDFYKHQIDVISILLSSTYDLLDIHLYEGVT